MIAVRVGVNGGIRAVDGILPRLRVYVVPHLTTSHVLERKMEQRRRPPSRAPGIRTCPAANRTPKSRQPPPPLCAASVAPARTSSLCSHLCRKLDNDNALRCHRLSDGLATGQLCVLQCGHCDHCEDHPGIIRPEVDGHNEDTKCTNRPHD